jgi:hypothetical protein
MTERADNDRVGAEAADRVRMPLNWMVQTLQNDGWRGVRSTEQLEIWIGQLETLAASARTELERRKGPDKEV